MRKRTLLLVATMFALNAALWLAQAGGALPASLGSYFFGPKLVRAEVVVRDGGVLHDYRVDRGRIRSVAANALTLAERDGTLVTVAVSSSAEVKLGGVPTPLTSLKRGLRATTVRDGETPASVVLATRG